VNQRKNVRKITYIYVKKLRRNTINSTKRLRFLSYNPLTNPDKKIK